ncbi:hypothetical protein L6452_40019 [Arctium lappa]|uniref:Uncharacterized protein n=1 Tax=Arctium lappa TaxID=4217 RepID=A0ACB8XU53_ARCLA|nr:hypothetical protein L6452_40019 [Arctium lappa]
MTTAARPTWAPAKGGNEQGGTRIFGPSQNYLVADITYIWKHYIILENAFNSKGKFRCTFRVDMALLWHFSDSKNSGKEGQDTQDEVQRRDLKEELEERERDCVWLQRREIVERAIIMYWKVDISPNNSIPLIGSRRELEERIVPRSVDADDADTDVKSDVERLTYYFCGFCDDEDDDDEDGTEALLAELEQIKKERAEEKLRKEHEEQEEELKLKEAELIRGNPLLNNPTSFNVKRRLGSVSNLDTWWDDDVVFKNQARGEMKAVKRFINDTIRSDFHRKFLQKYMK